MENRESKKSTRQGKRRLAVAAVVLPALIAMLCSSCAAVVPEESGAGGTTTASGIQATVSGTTEAGGSTAETTDGGTAATDTQTPPHTQGGTQAEETTAAGTTAAGTTKGTGATQTPPKTQAQGTNAPTQSGSAVPAAWQDGGIFSAYYSKAYARLQAMSVEEKAGQVLLARCPSTGAAEAAAQFHLGGYVLFGRDFQGKTADEVRKTLASYQAAADIPLMLATDEEGGTVVRVSGNAGIRAEKFRAPQEIYAAGGLDAIRADAAEKAALLVSLGVNVNLAPVCDVTSDKSAYIYPRTLGRGAEETGAYVAAVIKAFHAGNLSGTLKHFPGYGGNADTHTGVAVDSRPLSAFESGDFLPFEEGIRAGADCVLVSHTIMECLDAEHPASLSPAVHQKLRELGFTGLVMTDDLAMDAIKKYAEERDPAVQALLAGNDLLLLDDYAAGYAEILSALRAGVIPQETLDHAVFRVLSWKYARGLLK
ncbi:MAG TPA: beta-hexosaminidase [Firmicutes bacterium]|nr:beta-hexosaminidase [Bacillota bacterium]